MQFKKNLTYFIIASIISLIFYFLITKQLIYPTLFPIVKDGVINIFADWSVILSANLCKTKVDVYIENPCDFWNRYHVYGNILLNIPLIKEFPKFYYLVLPIIINFLFIYVVVTFFDFKKKFEYLTALPFIFSIPVLFVIERANIDNLIFLIIFLISINKNLILNYFLIILGTITKFYPIVSSIIFLFKRNLKKIIINLTFLVLIIFFILYFEIDSLKKISENSKQFSASAFLSFSFIGFVNHINDIKIVFQGKDYNWIKYIFILLILLVPIIFTLFSKVKFIFSDEKIKELFSKNCFENRLYILSTTIVLVCYFSFSNYMYREIFFLGLIPWILSQKKLSNFNSFYSFYYYALCGKFFISTILIYMYENHLKLFKPIATVTKHCLDFYIIFIISLIFISSVYSLTKKLFNN